MNGYHMDELVLKAKYLLASPDEIIIDGAVCVKDTRIISVGAYGRLRIRPDTKVMDFKDSAILPGFINSHTHLELTGLAGLVPFHGDFTSWIEGLLKLKFSWGEADYLSSIKIGALKSLESGTTTVSDITRSSYSFSALKDIPIRKVIFEEVIDFDPINVKHTINAVRHRLADIKQDVLLDTGISPHAPYTVSEQLYEECARLSQTLNILICTHIAETTDEVRFLTEGTGPFAHLLKKYKMLYPDWQPPRLTPILFLEKTGLLKLKNRVILIHCNYLSDKEIPVIEASGASVVFCPRSHRFFDHHAHPFQRLIEKGINVALGTDSLASNASLSILDEMRFIYNNFPGMPPSSILAMATINGAKALGKEDKIARLKVGYDADIAVVKLQGQSNNNIYKRLFSADSQNVFTMVNGLVCFDKYNS